MNMRKMVFIALLAIVSVSSQAQETCKAFTLPEFTTGKFVWMVRAGVGFNGVTGNAIDTQKALWEDDKYDGSFKKNIGYTAVFAFNKSFGSHPLYWGMELGFSMRGYQASAISAKTVKDQTTKDKFGRYPYYTFSRKTSDMTITCYDVQLSPFVLGYKYAFAKRMAADIHLGAYASYDFTGDEDVSSSSYVYYHTKAGDNTTSSEKENSVNIGDIKSLNRYDAGFILGVGYWFGRFNIDFSWQRGFVPVYDDGDELIMIGGKKGEEREFGNLFTNNLLLRIGYAF